MWRWGIAISALGLSMWGGLVVSYPLPFSWLETWQALFGSSDNELANITITATRLPRVLTAVWIGAMLALSGALLQTITRNPLASPSLLSVNAGASLAMVMASAWLPSVFAGYSMSAVTSIGGALSWLLVMLIGGGWRMNADRHRVILAGIAVSLFCMALTKLVIIIADDHAANIMNWLAGGIAHARWAEWRTVLPFGCLSALWVVFYASRLNLLHLSDESAQSLGVNLYQLRWLANGVALLLVGASVSVAGPVSFIGLLVPHWARYWVGYDLRKALPMSMILGAVLMLVADMVARAVAFPSEIPAGAILALIGAPVFVMFARGRR